MSKFVRKAIPFKPVRPETYKEAKRGKDIPALLYDLLVQPTPYPHEMKTYSILQAFLKGRKLPFIKDTIGNIYVRIGNEYEHEIMFTAHMDTVAKSTDPIKLIIDSEGMVFAETEEGHPSILGADDKVGMYILCRMIEKEIPGLYIFHIGEECGAKGSTYVAEKTPEIIRDIKKCVSFDRADYGDVIDRQNGRVCCSPEFSKALITALNFHAPPLQFWATDTGSYTDSASYMYDIPECTNLSVGYFRQHSTNEHFDAIWLENIFFRMLWSVDWDKLPVVRDPVASIPAVQTYNRGWENYGYNGGVTRTKKAPDLTSKATLTLLSGIKKLKEDIGGVTKQYEEMANKVFLAEFRAETLSGELVEALDEIEDILTTKDYWEDQAEFWRKKCQAETPTIN